MHPPVTWTDLTFQGFSLQVVAWLIRREAPKCQHDSKKKKKKKRGAGLQHPLEGTQNLDATTKACVLACTSLGPDRYLAPKERCMEGTRASCGQPSGHRAPENCRTMDQIP